MSNNNRIDVKIKLLNAQLIAAKTQVDNMNLDLVKKLDANQLIGVTLGLVSILIGSTFGLFYFSFNVFMKPQIDKVQEQSLEVQKQNIETQNLILKTQKQNEELIRLLKSK